MKKMKTIHKIAIFVLTLMMILIPAIQVQADEPLYVYLGEIEAVNNELIMQVGTNLENSTEGISYKVTLGDEELEILSVSDYESEKMQTSYVFLVDVSGSIKKSEMDDIKDILRSMINGMDEKDNASIMLIGNDVYAETFTSDKETLLQTVENIETLSEDTNLYYAINQAIDVLSTSEQCLDRKCIVILSDGQDDQISGITEKEVEEKINEVNIPICSVAVRGNDEKAVEIAKVMGSFSRMSPGGVHMIYGVEDIDAEAVAQNVFSVTQNIAVLKADISNYEANGTENYLQVEAVVDGVGSAADGYNVKSVFISEGVIEEEPESTIEESEVVESTEEADAEVENEQESNGLSAWIIVLIIAGIVCVIVIAVILIVLSNKKKKAKAKALLEEKERAAKAEKDAENKANEEKIGKTAVPLMDNESCRTEALPDMPVQESVATPTLEVKLTRVGNIEKETLTLVIKGELTIGRKKGQADVVFEQDHQLSGKHCKLVYDGTRVMLVDLGSLNGTLVNGVPISEPYQLSSDDKFYIGSMEWRINW